MFSSASKGTRVPGDPWAESAPLEVPAVRLAVRLAVRVAFNPGILTKQLRPPHLNQAAAPAQG